MTDAGVRCLVTGAGGFVGVALVRRLVQDGARVRALVLPGSRRTSDLRALGAEVVEGDVTDAASLAPCVAGIERVFHAAALVHGWQPWARYRTVNVEGTRNVACAAHAAGVARFVHVSTSDVFGIPRAGEVLDESAPLRPWGEPYPDTKIEGEQWLRGFARRTGLPVSIVYPGWVYGAGDEAFFPALADAIRSGMLVFWQRDTRLAWVHVANLADAIALVGRASEAAGHGYLVHDDVEAPTLEEVCARLAAIVGRPFRPRYVPYGVAFAAAWASEAAWRMLPLRGAPPILAADVKAFGHRFRFSTAEIRALGWSPRVGIAAGMEESYAYLAARGGEG
jgi:nucleoside-diphosphate-sugar epimerase